MQIKDIVNLSRHPLLDTEYQLENRAILQKTGAVLLPDFLQKKAIDMIVSEAMDKKGQAYYCADTHNVYLTNVSDDYPDNHVYNRQVVSSKGCIADDVIDRSSPLRTLYNDAGFKLFLQNILEEDTLYPYADNLSSVNIHYADDGHELGWHFDNSSFAITLLLQAPLAGGKFQYIKSLRNSSIGDFNFSGVEQALNGDCPIQELNIKAGTLVLFRGRDSMHRVTPVKGDKTRILSVLAYNNKPNIQLSELARQTFYGRVH